MAIEKQDNMKPTRREHTGGLVFCLFIRAYGVRVHARANVYARDRGGDGGAKIAMEATRNLCARKFHRAFPFRLLRGKWKTRQAFGGFFVLFRLRFRLSQRAKWRSDFLRLSSKDENGARRSRLRFLQFPACV